MNTGMNTRRKYTFALAFLSPLRQSRLRCLRCSRCSRCHSSQGLHAHCARNGGRLVAETANAPHTHSPTKNPRRPLNLRTIESTSGSRSGSSSRGNQGKGRPTSHKAMNTKNVSMQRRVYCSASWSGPIASQSNRTSPSHCYHCRRHHRHCR